MKKRILFVSVLLIALVSVIFCFMACEEHEHSYIEVIIAPSCIEDGYTLHKCVCGDEYKDTIVSALGHSYGEYTSNNDATCVNDGTKTAKCTRCEAKDIKIDENSKTGHTVVVDSAKAATCTETGLTEGSHCSVCNVVLTPQSVVEKVAHTESDWICDETINCLTTREKHKICTVCNTILKVATAEPETKHNFVNGKCTRCIATIYTRSGNFISFGSYPQTKVTDGTLTTVLTELAGPLPTSDNNQAWTSYGYYNQSSTTANYMWYIDKEYNGEKYRGVYFIEYRAYRVDFATGSTYSQQDDNGYKINTIYWFKYEPIQWKILSETNGLALIKCITAIDGQQYDASASNNYKDSEIRKWLNETFYELAFDDLQKELIQITTVDNSVVSANANNNASYYNNGENSFVCDNTEDKIFLLSANDVSNASYGFNSGLSSDGTRRIGASNYAFAQGITKYANGCTEWLLRSPYYTYSYKNLYINENGTAYYDRDVYRIMGVVPALTIKL